MKAKQIIILIVIVAALTVAGVFAYKFLMTSVEEEGAENTLAQQAKPNVILPKGTKLDFDTVKEFNPTGRLYSYPAVQPGDTGQPLNDIISPQ